MATEKQSTLTARGTVLDTQLNALANATYCALGSVEHDNSDNLDLWAIAELYVTYGTNPTVNTPVHLFGIKAPDGTNYQDGTASLRPPDDSFLGTFQLYNNTSAQRLYTRPFRLLPVKYKFMVYNLAGQAMGATGNTVKLFTYNRTIN